jgi:hypothetical protein
MLFCGECSGRVKEGVCLSCKKTCPVPQPPEPASSSDDDDLSATATKKPKVKLGHSGLALPPQCSTSPKWMHAENAKWSKKFPLGVIDATLSGITRLRLTGKVRERAL